MMEDCATSMSAPHGCTDDTAVIESFKEALTGRVGAERFRMWFTHGVTIAVDAGPNDVDTVDASDQASSVDTTDLPSDLPSEQQRRITLSIRGQFALDRLRQNFIREMRGAAMQACGVRTEVVLRLDEPAATQAQLPLTEDETTSEGSSADRATVSADSTGAEAVVHPPQNTQIVPGQEPSSGHEQARGSRQRQSGRTAKARSKRGRAQSISSYIADSSGSKRRTNTNDLRIDQAEQLEFPGLSTAKAGLVPQNGGPNSCNSSTSQQRSGASQPTAKNRAGSRTKASPKHDQPQVAGTEERKQAATVANFVAGTSNQLAYTALSMVCQDPKTASPIFFCGPTGTGKTHLMAAIAEQLRRRHRMRRVMHLSAEQFTNDFISSVGNSGITAFRRRYREVDALLIDDVQFLGAKKATLREMLYTVETLASAGRPLLFSGLQAPSEIAGLSQELAGRMASGLVCPIQPLDIDIRRQILERWIADRCPLEVPASLLDQINPMLAGDGRVVSGVANMINTLQRMFGRVPTLDEIRQFGGNLLRASTPIATLAVIETAVCDAFHLPHHTLRGVSQTRAVTGPRMLAMYLARQLTASAYSEIATHFGGKSHSTAISAENNVKKWLETGKSIGRGQLAMSTREAVARVENLLRSG
jgi:chromosomal replication initiator protein